MSQLEQVQITFAAAEDRLLMRLSTGAGEEFRFWLTRRFVRLLRPHLATHLSAQPHIKSQASTPAQRAMLEFEHQHAVQKADFKTPYKDAEKTLPLGAQPLLLTRFTINPLDAGKVMLRLAPEQGAGIDLALDPPLVHSILALIDNALAATDWNLDAALPAAATDVTSSSIN